MSAEPVPRSMEAATPPAVAGGAARRVARANGWWGTAIFLASEVTLFGVLFGTYFYLRFKTVSWPPPGIEEPKTVVPLTLVAVLVITSVPMQLASSAARRGRVRLAWWAIFAALVVQTGYFAMEMHLFHADLAKFTPEGSAYGSIYYTLLGAHHFHVFVGLLIDVWLLARLTTGLTSYRVIGVQSAALYWHVVNVLALLVIGAILSPAI